MKTKMKDWTHQGSFKLHSLWESLYFLEKSPSKRSLRNESFLNRLLWNRIIFKTSGEGKNFTVVEGNRFFLQCQIRTWSLIGNNINCQNLEFCCYHSKWSYKPVVSKSWSGSSQREWILNRGVSVCFVSKQSTPGKKKKSLNVSCSNCERDLGEHPIPMRDEWVSTLWKKSRDSLGAKVSLRNLLPSSPADPSLEPCSCEFS